MGISFRQKGNWDKTDYWLRSTQKVSIRQIVEPYAEIGLTALKEATPVKTGKTRDSWYYIIETPAAGVTRITWCNNNANDGANIAVLIQYGHGTQNGAYVQGLDYINPVIRPVFNSLSDKVYKEVTAEYGH